MGISARPVYCGAGRTHLASLLSLEPSNPTDILIYGPSGSGKTTLLQGTAEMLNAASTKEGALTTPALYCAGVEIYAALFIRENERFLTRLATEPLVMIDDIDGLLDKDNGVRALSLLLEERKRSGLRTVLAFDGLQDEAIAAVPSAFVDAAEAIGMEPLAGSDLVDFVRWLLGAYGGESGVAFAEDVPEVVCTMAPTMEEADKAVRYLTTASDLAKGKEVSAEDVLGALAS